MAFLKGPTPGYSPRADALAINPRLKCRKKTAMNITGYIVYDGDKAIASAGNAQDAWRKAWANIAANAT